MRNLILGLLCLSVSCLAQDSLSPALEIRLLQLDSAERAYDTSKSTDSRSKLVQVYSNFISDWCSKPAQSPGDIAAVEKRCQSVEERFLSLSNHEFARLCQKLARSSAACQGAMQSAKLPKTPNPLDQVEKMLQQQPRQTPLPPAKIPTDRLDPERQRTFELVRALTRSLSEYRLSPIPAKRELVIGNYTALLSQVCPEPSTLNQECKFYTSELLRFDPANQLASCLNKNRSFPQCRMFAGPPAPPASTPKDRSGFTTF